MKNNYKLRYFEQNGMPPTSNNNLMLYIILHLCTFKTPIKYHFYQ